VLLVISTSSPACSVALFAGDRLLAHAHEIIGRGHAERLLPLIASLPGGGRADRIMVDCGPGSFTGVRVGLAAAQGLALGWGARLTGCTSLALIAAAVAASKDPFLVALDGGHGELFVQNFSQDGQPRDAINSLPLAIAAKLATPPVYGSGAASLVALRGTGTAQELLPDARQASLLRPQGYVDPPTPCYIRAPDAKIAP
jgi:tRNA threonylcarbamoyladenosine biosynthesis protein TsaB